MNSNTLALFFVMTMYFISTWIQMGVYGNILNQIYSHLQKQLPVTEMKK